MLSKIRIHPLARAARSTSASGKPADLHRPVAILSLAAASYGARPSDDMTVPTGFDPVAVALFESIVEGAFLVANADGRFDDDERGTFERIVVEACGGTVGSQQIAALLGDLQKQLRGEGMDRRIEQLAKSVTKREHGQEVLRFCCLMAQASDRISAGEREVLTKIAATFGLDAADVQSALADAERALLSASAGEKK
jgi:tellurite resistance protein